MTLAITPDGRTLYVATSGMSGELGQTGPSSVTAIDTATGRVRASVTWKAQPIDLTIAPNGKTVWVASITAARETTADDTVTPISVASNQPGPSFHTAGWLNAQDDAPSSVALSPDSRALYVTAGSGLEIFHASLPPRGRAAFR
jgi:DNA-binding beta-propeller fold protein YncE